MKDQATSKDRRVALQHVTSFPLRHGGDCWLLGITPELVLYVEETSVQNDDAEIARHAFQVRETALERVETAAKLPAEMVKPHSCSQTSALNYSGPRHRGRREEDRISDLVLPLTVAEKIQAIQALRLPIAPPMVLGLAESYVLAEALVAPPDTFLVCRRLRLAYALSQPKVDEDNAPYDYDTAVLYTAHLYNGAADDPLTFDQVFMGLPGAKLYRSMDCLAYQGYVFVADGGEHERRSAIHLWHIQPYEMAQGESA